jgi:cytosolic iron-sulfur assembly component 3
LITSECPGWVCYAEKRHGEFVLPFISTAKSPQQVMGSLVKSVLAERLSVEPAHIFHCTVMPCYDKKLEASRSDFYSEVMHSHDVDCVLSTAELVQLIDERLCRGSEAAHALEAAGEQATVAHRAAFAEEARKQFNALPLTAAAPDSPFANVASLEDQTSLGADQYGSGGYLEHALRHAATALYGEGTVIHEKVGRNRDLREYWVEVDGERRLHCAQVYGFRNIQTLLRKMKAKSKRVRCTYLLVEVMACPSGCLNGGGQPRPRVECGEEDLKSTLERVCLAHSGGLRQQPSAHERVITQLYEEWVHGEPGSERARALLHTTYHAVREDNVNPLTIKW